MKLIHGDSLIKLKELEDNSIDAVVTDPPYGLKFMGKKWDYDVPSVELWKEIFRVMKPGAFLLSFAGTRTYHRMAVNIEDAGFEIRDMISWLYGSGFPKSLNIGKQIDKRFKERLEYKEFADYFKIKRKKYGILKKLAGKIVNNCKNIESAIALVNNWELGKMIPTNKNWKIVKKELNMSNRFDKLVEEKTKRFKEAEREIIRKSKNQIGKYKNSEWVKNNKGIYRNDIKLINYDTIPATPEAKMWEGWGTSLKPACEPIVVARKPLSEKNVALNVLKWGTGGINIDTCRVIYNNSDKNPATNPLYRMENNYKNNHNPDNGSSNYQIKKEVYEAKCNPQGRFPANIILDEEAGKILDEQSGDLKSGSMKKGMGGFGNGNKNCYGESNGAKDSKKYTSSKGGASRFFYCAKASKKERNLGCENLEEQAGIRINAPRENENVKTPNRKNNHPTVKPIKLMEYLVKLVSKEGATILDPFCGSGTTLLACQRLNRKGIGIEREENYIKIAQARLNSSPNKTTTENEK